MAKPGKVANHHCWKIYRRPAATISPQSAVGGGIPKPIKLNPAAGRIANPRVHFCFVGDGRRRRQVERRIRRAGLQRRVHLTGLLRPTEMPLVMHASDIVVHCSLREGLARALPQAMLAGKPVVSFDVDGAREVVDAYTGLLLEPGDVGGLTTAIRTLAAAPDLRERLGQEGRKRALGRFDHKLMVERIEALYERLLGG